MMENRTNSTKIWFCNHNTTDLIGNMEKRLTLVYPFLLVVCLISNTANLAIYQHKFLRSSTTIRMLSAKGVANMISTISLFPNFLKSVPQWSQRRDINDLYWIALPYMMLITNTFATFAIWLTMAVSLERYVLVGFPIQAKYLSTMRNAMLTILGTFFAAILLQVQSFIARKLYIIQCFDLRTSSNDYYYLYVVHRKFTKLQNAYYYSYSITTIVAPMIVMIYTTLLINYHLFWSSKRFATSAIEQKRCVTRLSLSTTICHLIFEMPHFAVFIIAAVATSAETVEFWNQWEPLVALANFLSVLNNSIPFFVYLLCSKRYRLIAKTVLCCAPTEISKANETNDLRSEFNRGQSCVRKNLVDNTFSTHLSCANVKQSPSMKKIQLAKNRKRSYSCIECKSPNMEMLRPPSINETTSLLISATNSS